MIDLDAEIVALLVAGESEREVCRQLGCTMGRVRAGLDDSATRRFAPGCAARVRAESLATLDALEGPSRRGVGDKALIERIRRQRARLMQTA
jgi:hypothetical protein